MKISTKTLNAYKRKHGLGRIDRLSARQFRELLAMEGRQGDKAFSFEYLVEVTERGYRVELIGKHLSANRYNAMPRRRQYAYKNAIKDAMERFRMANLALVKSFDTLERAKIEFTFVNPVSRDADNNHHTRKPLQDTFTRLGLIRDDKRENIGRPVEHEVIDKQYRVVATILSPEE